MEIQNKKNQQKEFVLKFINQILINSGKEKINDLTDFKDIDRELIIAQSGIITDEFLNEALILFTKSEIQWNNRNRIKYYIISLFNNLLKCLDHKIIISKKEVPKILDDKKYRRCHRYFTIKKK